jgi:hypothetical protein
VLLCSSCVVGIVLWTGIFEKWNCNYRTERIEKWKETGKINLQSCL